MSDIFIDLRDQPVAGGIRPAPHVHLRGLGNRQPVLMIHGFNTNMAEAGTAYDAFRELIVRQAPRLAERLCPIYWPGDSGLKGGGYPWLVERARTCGAMLADWLATREGEIVIVAHSLGCRLTLEALAELAGRDGDQQVRPRLRLFLMAAAVPVALMAEEGRLAQALSRTHSVDVLNSRSDGVLAFWFRLGQSVAPGEAHLLPEAVGLRGLPGALIWSRVAEMPGYDHNSYWEGQRMASHLAHRLGAAVHKPRPVRLTSPARQMPVRELPGERPGPPRRKISLRR